MKRVSMIVFCLVVLLSSKANGDPVASFSSYSEGRRLDFPITEEALKNAPTWPEISDTPILSPRIAERFARKKLGGLVFESSEWRLESIALHPWSNHWYYVISYSGTLPPGIIDGAVEKMRIPVLMDGTIPEPKISCSQFTKGRVHNQCVKRSR